MSRRCVVFILLSFFIVFFSVLSYAPVFEAFIAGFGSTRTARYLIGAVYAPSLIVVTGLSLGVVLSSCCSPGCSGAGRALGLFAKRFRVVLVPGLVGLFLGVFLGEATRLTVFLFFVDLLVAAAYVVAVVAWLFVVLASVVSEVMGVRRSLLYWVLSMLIASLVVGVTRFVLAGALPVLDAPVIRPGLSDVLLNELVEKYVPSYVEVLTAPLWPILVPLVYRALWRRWPRPGR